MRGNWMLIAGIAAILAIGAGAITWWFAGQAGQKKKPAVSAQAPTPPSNPNEISLPGKIQAQEMIPVASPIEGIIDELFVDAGNEVYEGQLIARVRNGKLASSLEATTAEVEKLKSRIASIEGAIVAAKLEASRASADASRGKSEFDRADRAFQRQQMLLKEGATPRLVFEKAEREYKQALADYESVADLARAADERVSTLNRDLDAAKKLLDGKNEELENAKEEAAQGEVKSPADGLVISRKGTPGEPITPAIEDFFVIATNLGALQAVLDPDPAQFAKIKPGQMAGVRIAEAGDEIPGVVSGIRGNQVLVDFISPDSTIRPGVTAQVRIVVAQAAAAGQ